MAQQIEQGDYIFFQDATVGGPPILWDWYFPGGSPTGSAFQNPIIQYFSPNSSGYNVRLYVEDKFYNFSTKTENNAIFVYPENLSGINLSFSPLPPNQYQSVLSPVAMSQTVNYTVSGPTGKLSYYDWSLPGTGGFTGSNSETQLLAINSWLSLTGSELGAVYSTTTVSASVVYFSVTGNSTSTSTSVTFIKSGHREEFNFLSATGAFPSPTTQYAQVINTVQTTSSIGLGGGGVVLLVDQPYPPNAIDNLSSRVQGEVVNFWSCSKDFVFPGGSSIYGVISNMQFVASKLAFDVLNVPYTGWETLSRYISGQYMFPNDISNYFNNSFYLGDINNEIQGNLNGITDVGLNGINSLFFNDAYYASESSVSLNRSLYSMYPAAYILNLDGGYGNGFGLQCLPSTSLVGSDVKLKLIVKFSTDGTFSGYQSGYDDIINITISGTDNLIGNSPDNNLILAQDTAGGSGYVSLINSALATAGYYTNIEAISSPDYCFKPSMYSMTVGQNFHGMKLVIKDRVKPSLPSLKIIKLEIIGNNTSWKLPYSQYPVAGTSNMSGNWLCFYDEIISNPYQDFNTDKQPFRGFQFRGNS